MAKSDLGTTIAVVAIGFVVAIGIVVGWWFFGQNIGLITGGSYAVVTKTEIRKSTVSLALGDILWIKTPKGGRGAIRFDRMTGDWGADYTSWYLPAGSPVSFPSVTPTHGHVFEKYWRKRGSSVEDIGGDYTVECGPTSIEWSASTWLYIPAGHQFAVSENTSAGIEVDSASLNWHTSRGQ